MALFIRLQHMFYPDREVLEWPANKKMIAALFPIGIRKGELHEELDTFRRENDNLNDEELVAFLDSFLTRSSDVQ